MKNNLPYIERDISWLHFNYRVLQESKDARNPLMERIKFLAIYSNNLGEFFRVRIANLKNLVRLGKKTKRELGFKPEDILVETLNIVNKQQEEFSQIFKSSIAPELLKNKIKFIRRKALSEKQKEFIEEYFNQNLLPYIQPILLYGSKVKPFLVNGALYLAINMISKDDKKVHYGLVSIPSNHVDRFTILPSEKTGFTEIILLDDILRECVRWVFPGFEIKDTYSIKINRDAELYIDNEFDGDLISKIKNSLLKRDVGPASRMVYDRTMQKDFVKYLRKTFDLTELDCLPEGRYHNNFDFFKFPKFENPKFYNKTLPPLKNHPLHQAKDIFEKIKEKDYLLKFPYHSYEPVIQFFEQAAEDPTVTDIKIVQYRVSSSSRIMNALIKAAKSGKNVFSFIEVKARFDEEANISWGEKLEKSGVKVVYSMPNLKVHAKIATITRTEKNKTTTYGYLSTGNFHEGTAKLYTDFGLFTSKIKILKEVESVFKYLDTKDHKHLNFKLLGVGQANLKPMLINLVKSEIKRAKKGEAASMILKMNSLQDKEMIELLYEASNAGVNIKLIIRGICCLVPGVKGYSEKIDAISIVDRFLEHSRVFIFNNGGNKKVYLSSADWMERNLHHRVEVMFPIQDQKIKKTILKLMQLQLDDNLKARSLKFMKMNEYHKKGNNKVQSQIATYELFKNKNLTDFEC